MNNNGPKPRASSTISVIMAVFNCSEYLDESIASIQNQTILDWELICVDDASTDNSADIIAAYSAEDRRVRLVRLPHNRGPAAARNVGLAHARGAYIAILDSDDIAPSYRFETSLRAFSENRNLGLLGGQYHVIDATSKTRAYYPLPQLDHRRFRSALLQGSMPIPHSSCMVRRKVLVDIGGYDERLPASQDFDMVLRASAQTHCARIASCLLLYRQRPNQISEDAALAQTLYAEFALARARASEHGRVFDEATALGGIQKRVAQRRGFSRVTGRRLLRLALSAAQSGDSERFRLLASRAYGHWPFSPVTLAFQVIARLPAGLRVSCLRGVATLRRLTRGRSVATHG
jgi:hypothetical protein